MSGRRKRRFAWPAGVLAVATVTAVVLVSASSADPGPPGPPGSDHGPKVIHLHGKFRNIIQHFGCPQSTATPTPVCSTFDADGEIKGSGFVVIDTDPSGEFGVSLAHTVVTTKRGELHCHESALFVFPPDQDGISPFVDICKIDPTGTGIYAGASGFIQESGTFDFTQNPPVGELDYTGTLRLT